MEKYSDITPSTKTMQGWRERPPTSHSLKIKNFSEFEKSTLRDDGKYQSRLFSSGGYNWRMTIYPKGNDKDNGIGFISMYVEIDTTRPASILRTELFADFRFYVYNNKQKKYFTIQDVESKPFNILRTTWGIPKVIKLDTFNDHENGYIFGGAQCEFGVDVFVASPTTIREILSFDDKLSYPKFSWTLEKFSELKESQYKSNLFFMGGRKWLLTLYPKGDSKVTDGKWLSFFLNLASTETLEDDEKIFARAHLRVLDPFGNNHFAEKITGRWFNKAYRSWGIREFKPVDEIRKAYLDKYDNLNVEVEFEVVSETKYSLP